jgi:hypothetical protein
MPSPTATPTPEEDFTKVDILIIIAVLLIDSDKLNLLSNIFYMKLLSKNVVLAYSNHRQN